jgi:hypothetical protein
MIRKEEQDKGVKALDLSGTYVVSTKKTMLNILKDIRMAKR